MQKESSMPIKLLESFQEGTYIARISGKSRNGAHTLLTLSVPSGNKGKRDILYAYTNHACEEIISQTLPQLQPETYVEGTFVRSRKSGKIILIDIKQFHYGFFTVFGLHLDEENSVHLRMRIRALKRSFNLSEALHTQEDVLKAIREVQQSLLEGNVCYFLGNALFASARLSAEQKEVFLNEIRHWLTRYYENYV